MYKVYTIYTHDEQGNEILLCEGPSIEELSRKFVSVPEYQKYNINELEIGRFVKEGEYDKDIPMLPENDIPNEDDDYFEQLRERLEKL